MRIGRSPCTEEEDERSVVAVVGVRLGFPNLVPKLYITPAIVTPIRAVLLVPHFQTIFERLKKLYRNYQLLEKVVYSRRELYHDPGRTDSVHFNFKVCF